MCTSKYRNNFETYSTNFFLINCANFTWKTCRFNSIKCSFYNYFPIQTAFLTWVRIHSGLLIFVKILYIGFNIELILTTCKNLILNLNVYFVSDIDIIPRLTVWLLQIFFIGQIILNYAVYYIYYREVKKM